MGRIKTKDIKSAGRELLALHENTFTADFEENKKLINSMSLTSQKKIRNKLAGYLTRQVKISHRKK